MELLLVLLVLGCAVLIIAGPLRTGRPEAADQGLQAERAELEAAREVKYGEIRDLELDFRTGKLSDADFGAQNRALRAEAVELLRRLDALEGKAAE